ncbi:MAG: hypothetical protein WAU86_02405 [Oricola sp.]
MKKQLALAIALLVSGACTALADHNSKWGEGTALDPTGIHDARIDSLDTAGEEPFAAADIAGDGQPFDLLAFMRQGRPDTIDIEQGGSVGTDASSMGGGSDHGGGSDNGGGGRN